MIRLERTRLGPRFLHVVPEELIVMHNHIHGLLRFLEEPRAHRASLGKVVGAFKSLTTRAYSAGVKSHRWRRFEGRLWQPGHFDHIVRSDKDHMRVVRYIVRNSACWWSDPVHPDRRRIGR